MTISLHNVVPKPLEGNYAPGSIWGSEVVLQAGQYYLVKAFSGRGKSTLLSYLMGLRSDYSGSIRFDDTDIKSLGPKAWADIRRDTIAMVFQDLRLFDELSAMENIMVKQALSTSVSKDDIIQMADMLEVKHLLDKPVKYLSMGQQQRFAIIRALSQPFKWLLLDEPYSHIDSENIKRAEVLIESCCRKNKAGMVLTSLGDTYNLPYHHTLTV